MVISPVDSVIHTLNNQTSQQYSKQGGEKKSNSDLSCPLGQDWPPWLPYCFQNSKKTLEVCNSDSTFLWKWHAVNVLFTWYLSRETLWWRIAFIAIYKVLSMPERKYLKIENGVCVYLYIAWETLWKKKMQWRFTQVLSNFSIVCIRLCKQEAAVSYFFCKGKSTKIAITMFTYSTVQK